MKIRIMSDLHLDHRNMVYKPCGEDVIVLAGDIAEQPHLFEEFISTIKVPIIAVIGNHEYYGHNFDKHLPALKNIGYLHNEIKVIDDVHFIVGTMWTDFKLFGISEEWFVRQACQRMMPEFSDPRFQVKKNDNGGERPFTTFDCQDEFTEFERFLAYALRETEGKKRVVVTHFCPHQNSIAPRFRFAQSSGYFSSHMVRHMGWDGLWIHGHTHTHFDYIIGETRVICNPRGYSERENTKFDPNFMVEI